jgi:hypothetical protein
MGLRLMGAGTAAGEEERGAGEGRKRACAAQAWRLAAEEGLRAVRLLQLAALAADGPAGPTARDGAAPAADGELAGAPLAEEPAADGEADARRPISIWQPAEEAGEPVWVRPPPGPFGDHYATAPVLRPRRPGGPRRIAFFGESAAAGYLYAPHLTPAGVLQAQLREVAGPGSWEVIDLARTNETLASLAATVEAALQLAPDAVVIYAGNNWNLLETPAISPYPPSVTGRQRYALALAGGGVRGPAEAARRELGRVAGRALTRIAGAGREAGVPVVAVLPEVNLADWESRQPVAWLPGDGVGRWYGLYRRCRRLLGRRDFAAAAAAAWEMIDLDGESCPTSCRLLAAACRGLGEEARAREAALAEIDAGSYATLCFLGAPQATTTARDLLGRAVERFGFAAVDLRPVFAAVGGSPLPGRRLFLDYCHLTAAGMKAAMAAVVAAVLRLGAGGDGDWRRLLAALPDPEVGAAAEATALLGAAVHTAHRLVAVSPRRPLIEHWCRQALAASPGVAAAMADLVAARAAPCPAVLAAAQERNAASPYRLTLQHGWRWDHLDGELVAALLAVLRAAGEEGAAAAAEGELLARRAVPPQGSELAHPPFYLAQPLERFYPEVMAFADLPERATLRCPWPETGFDLVVASPGGLEVDLTLRLPAVAGAPGRRGRVAVALDGAPVGEVAAAAGWSRHRLAVPAGALGRGLHRLTLRWPLPPPVGEEALASAVRRLELGREADLHPVFGEVFSLRVSPG